MIPRLLQNAFPRTVALRVATVALAAAAVMSLLSPPPVVAALVAALGVAITALLTVPRAPDAEMAELLRGNLDVLQVLGGTVARREHHKAGENSRLVLYAVRIAEKAGLPADDIRLLIKGAFVHDIGNIILPEEVLSKPGRLDEIEYEAVKTHVFHGVEILKSSCWLRDASPLVRSHHEKWDGSGYPDALRGRDIPVGARVFALADVFDALTSERPYRGPLPLDKAMDVMLKGRGGHFDPELFDAFAAIARAMYGEIQTRSEADIEQELLAIAFRYFQSAGQRR
jgi:HD-GYP domain-containing protein (c-di-GMP phosphodiesterase class II)